MGVKEDLGDTRPYWKVLVSLVFSLTATVFLHLFPYWLLLQNLSIRMMPFWPKLFTMQLSINLKRQDR